MGVLTTHIDNISGCGEPDALLKIRGFPEQLFGTMELQENSFVRAGAELKQDAKFPVTLAQADLSQNLHLGTSPQL